MTKHSSGSGQAPGSSASGSGGSQQGSGSWETTQPPPPTPASAPQEGERQGALVLLWSREEPERVGQVCLFPWQEGFRFTLGRGDPSAGGIAHFGRQRPGRFESRGPLRARTISRRQLGLEVLSDGRIALTNLGLCPLLAQGCVVQNLVLQEGDLVELQDTLLLLVSSRPAHLQPIPDAFLPPSFGAPDDLGLVGESPAMVQLRARIAALGPLDTHLLVLGASGAGKELVAQGIHKRSPRANRPLVARSAATLPEGLITAELFGNMANYPHQGMPERPGLVGAAQDSTLLLDEFGELPQTLQTQLLRVLDQGEYQRLGETRVRTANFRLIAMTNREEQALKHDVRARFAGRLVVPDLNERREDIPLLIRHLLGRYVAASTGPGAESPSSKTSPVALEISCELVKALVMHPYRTQMRELNELLLESLLERQGHRLCVPSRLRARADLAPAGGVVRANQQAGLDLEPLPPFTLAEHERLKLLRRFGFQIGELVASGEYPANRQTIDLHLRQLMARALVWTEGSVARAVEHLAAGGETSRVRLQARMNTWLSHLRDRRSLPEFAGSEGQARLEKSLLAEYRGFRGILDVLKWIEDRSAGASSP